ncbi:MAG: hypothetical protein WAQ52_08220 [Terriglobales bacterium]
MRKILFALVLGLFLPGYVFGASCPKDKHSGITALALDADINADHTVSLRWQQKFLDAIFKSPRYCFVANKADANVIVSVSAVDTSPRDFRNDRAAVSTVAIFADNTKFLMHLLQLCSPVDVDSCAERTLTQLDNQLTTYPDDLKLKE